MGITVTLRGGSGDMLKSSYDPNLDGVIALAELDTKINKVSELNVDADLVIGAHNITIGAGQTVDGRDISALDPNNDLAMPGKIVKASDTLRHSHDAAVIDWQNTVYEVKKTITLKTDLIGVIRITFRLLGFSETDDAFGMIYRNGISLGGTIHRTNSAAYETKTEDLASRTWKQGDTIELYCKGEGAHDHDVKEFRLYWDEGDFGVNT